MKTMGVLKVIAATAIATYGIVSSVLLLVIMADFMGMPEAFGRPDAFSMDERRYVLIAIAPAFLALAYFLATHGNTQKEKIRKGESAMANQGIPDFEWQAFDHQDYECGIFWLLIESPEVDIDASDDGQTVGRHTGKVVRSAVLAMVEEDGDGLPYFDAIDSANFGQVSDDDVVTHFAEVKAPAVPAN